MKLTTGEHTSRTSQPPRLTPRTGSVPYANEGLIALSPTTLRARRAKRAKAATRRQVVVMTIDCVEGGVQGTRTTNFEYEGICMRRGEHHVQPTSPRPLQTAAIWC